MRSLYRRDREERALSSAFLGWHRGRVEEEKRAAPLEGPEDTRYWTLSSN